MTTTRRAALGALAGASALAIPALAGPGPSAESGKPATLEQLAAMDFEPWRHAEGDWEPPSNKEWNGMLITIRLAYATMFRSKAQLIDMVVKEEEAAMDMAEAVFNVADFCKGLSALMDAAETRLMVACAAAPGGVV